ncbi:hypothetical protein M7I_1715 [Glarea lozoyensis 74030]|uniref:Uncharacterized protein n=1 Tax=Glarea lozoyensis (strain ATCC 74030 / MF5533) TaxID=1104152 RepID=H0EGU4_GLAL7|nr:hypothetical protein M7I_1715 [Glarea lozoyensis 74030]
MYHFNYVNFEIDTLEISHELEFVNKNNTYQKDTFLNREGCLEESDLDRVQSVAVRDLYWDLCETRAKRFFKNGIAKSFRHLRELVFLSEFTLNPESQESLRQEITSLFQVEKASNPQCRIPEIIFLQYGYEEFPGYYPRYGRISGRYNCYPVTTGNTYECHM